MKENRILKVLAIAAVAVLVFATVQARADVYMKQKTHTDAFTMMGQSQPEKNETMVFWLGDNKARTDIESGTSTILLADKKIIYMIDHNKKQYSEMPLDFDKMIEEAAEAKAGEDPEKAEAMKKMPGFMKNMMKNVMGGMSAKVTETNETKKIGSWNCRKYLVEMDMGMIGKNQSESWATEDLHVNYEMAFTMTNAMMAGQAGFENIIKEMKKIKGVVVYQVGKTKVMGADVASTTEVIECVNKDAPAGTYEVPAGYQKVKGIKK
jgi:hypothetical protein